MRRKNNDKLSIFISLILRHKPEVIGITLDSAGYANVNELIEGINKQNKQIDMELLEEIVRTDSKQRYSFNEDKTKIRANQGHSIKVDVGLKECVPPDVLYHGTASRNVISIQQKGLLKMNRLYVHLTESLITAKTVGDRYSNDTTILLIDSKSMYNDGYKFYLSENRVWLTEKVPSNYITAYSNIVPTKYGQLSERDVEDFEVEFTTTKYSTEQVDLLSTKIKNAILNRN